MASLKHQVQSFIVVSAKEPILTVHLDLTVGEAAGSVPPECLGGGGRGISVSL